MNFFKANHKQYTLDYQTCDLQPTRSEIRGFHYNYLEEHKLKALKNSKGSLNAKMLFFPKGIWDNARCHEKKASENDIDKKTDNV